jgi:hypothetical protein
VRDQKPENVECPTTDRHGHENAPLILPEQHTATPIEAKIV